MDGVVREVNVMVLGNGLKLLRANIVRFEINQLRHHTPLSQSYINRKPHTHTISHPDTRYI